MTPDQLTALAARLRDGCRDMVTGESLFAGETSTASAEDVEAAADYLRQCAQAEPVAWNYTTIAGTRITHYADRLDVAQLAYDMKAAREYPNAHKVIPLYTHPQPQQAGVPDAPDLDSTVVNEACWAFTEAMPHALSVQVWNDLKPAIYAALMHYHRAMLAAAPQPPSAQADADWYCSTCKCSVPGEHVTFDETHDTRCGGCGNKVSAVDPQPDAVEALRWEKPGPVSPNHPLECLIVLSALRQSDGDWWIRGDKFLADYLPIAWAPDTPEARAVLAAQGGKDE